MKLTSADKAQQSTQPDPPSAEPAVPLLDEDPRTELADPLEIEETLRRVRGAGRKTDPPGRMSLVAAPEDLARRFLKDAAGGKDEP